MITYVELANGPLASGPKTRALASVVTANQLLAKKSSTWAPQLFLQSPQLNFYAKMDDVDFDPKQHSEEQCPVCQGVEAVEVQLCVPCFQKEFSS
ncbi:MAG: hypothetical protein ACE5OZ_11560 [Candidatus Heimdallarchaeota archaeon]